MGIHLNKSGIEKSYESSHNWMHTGTEYFTITLVRSLPPLTGEGAEGGWGYDNSFNIEIHFFQALY